MSKIDSEYIKEALKAVVVKEMLSYIDVGFPDHVMVCFGMLALGDFCKKDITEIQELYDEPVFVSANVLYEKSQTNMIYNKLYDIMGIDD